MKTVSPKATLRDVADRVGVHQTTVSLALRDHPRIPLSTRQRIKRVAHALGYRVDPLVTALMRTRRMRTNTVHGVLAYVTDHATRLGWRSVHRDPADAFSGARAQAELQGYKLEHFWFSEPGITPPRFGEILRTRGIRGAILGALPAGRSSLAFEHDGFSCVALGLTLSSPTVARVSEDHFDTVFQAMEQCRARDYRRIGLVFSEANDSPPIRERWIAAFYRQQLKFPEPDRLAPFEDVAPGLATFARWFGTVRPDALIVTRAQTVLPWLKAMAVAAPEDVGLVDLDPHAKPELAGVRYDSARLGALAVEMLVGLMHRHDTGRAKSSREEVLLKGNWRNGMTLPPVASPISSALDAGCS